MEESKEMQNDAIEATTQSVNTEETISENSKDMLAEPSAESTQADEPTAQPETEPVSETAPETTVTETPESTDAPQETAPEEQPEEAEPVEEEEIVPDYSNYSRDALTETLKELLQEQDITKIKNRVAAINLCFNNADREFKKAAFEKFLEEGGNKDEYVSSDDAIAEAFRKEYNTYRERRQKHIDELEARKQQNLEQKKQILEELRNLIDSDNESLKQTYDKFNAIQDKWKSIGDVPRS